METAKANSLRLDDYLLHLLSILLERAEQSKNFEIDEDLITQKDAMNNIYNEYYADFITGQRDIDAEWDSFVSEWNANGGDEFSEYFDSIF